MTMPFNPRKTPPLERRGSIRSLNCAERGTRKQVADARAERAGHGVPYVLAHLARRALGGLQRDVAGKAFGDDHIDLAPADIVAFDKALIIEIGKFLLAQDAAGLAHRLKTL